MSTRILTEEELKFAINDLLSYHSCATEDLDRVSDVVREGDMKKATDLLNQGGLSYMLPDGDQGNVK